MLNPFNDSYFQSTAPLTVVILAGLDAVARVGRGSPGGRDHFERFGLKRTHHLIVFRIAAGCDDDAFLCGPESHRKLSGNG